MTDRDDVLAEARAALAGITPWPWEVDIHDESPLDSIVSVADDRIGGWVEVARSLGEDSVFIAAAPGLVARLADEVERLREWQRLHSADVLSVLAEQAEVEEQRDEALAAVARVRELADAWKSCGMVDAPPTVQYMGGLVRRALDGETDR